MQLDLFNTQEELMDMRFWDAVRYYDRKKKELCKIERDTDLEEIFKNNPQTVLFK